TVSIVSDKTNNTTCSGESIKFTATPQNAGSNPTYQWRVNGVNRTGETNSTFTVSNLTNGQKISVRMLPDCDGATGVNSNDIQILVHSLPSAPTITGDNSVCAGDNISLSASSVSGAIYHWTGPNNFTATGKD